MTRRLPSLLAKSTSLGNGRRGRPPAAVIEARNGELLDRALDLFLEHGFAATTIEMISASLGMGRRTIYARYGDKEMLFRAALQKAIDEWIVPVEDLRAAEAESLEAPCSASRGCGRRTSRSLQAGGWYASPRPRPTPDPMLPSTCAGR